MQVEVKPDTKEYYIGKASLSTQYDTLLPLFGEKDDKRCRLYLDMLHDNYIKYRICKIYNHSKDIPHQMKCQFYDDGTPTTTHDTIHKEMYIFKYELEYRLCLTNNMDNKTVSRSQFCIIEYLKVLEYFLKNKDLSNIYNYFEKILNKLKNLFDNPPEFHDDRSKKNYFTLIHGHIEFIEEIIKRYILEIHYYIYLKLLAQHITFPNFSYKYNSFFRLSSENNTINHLRDKADGDLSIINGINLLLLLEKSTLFNSLDKYNSLDNILSIQNNITKIFKNRLDEIDPMELSGRFYINIINKYFPDPDVFYMAEIFPESDPGPDSGYDSDYGDASPFASIDTISSKVTSVVSPRSSRSGSGSGLIGGMMQQKSYLDQKKMEDELRAKNSQIKLKHSMETHEEQTTIANPHSNPTLGTRSSKKSLQRSLTAPLLSSELDLKHHIPPNSVNDIGNPPHHGSPRQESLNQEENTHPDPDMLFYRFGLPYNLLSSDRDQNIAQFKNIMNIHKDFNIYIEPTTIFNPDYFKYEFFNDNIETKFFPHTLRSYIEDVNIIDQYIISYIIFKSTNPYSNANMIHTYVDIDIYQPLHDLELLLLKHNNFIHDMYKCQQTQDQNILYSIPKLLYFIYNIYKYCNIYNLINYYLEHISTFNKIAQEGQKINNLYTKCTVQIPYPSISRTDQWEQQLSSVVNTIIIHILYTIFNPVFYYSNRDRKGGQRDLVPNIDKETIINITRTIEYGNVEIEISNGINDIMMGNIQYDDYKFYFLMDIFTFLLKYLYVIEENYHNKHINKDKLQTFIGILVIPHPIPYNIFNISDIKYSQEIIINEDWVENYSTIRENILDYITFKGNEIIDKIKEYKIFTYSNDISDNIDEVKRNIRHIKDIFTKLPSPITSIELIIIFLYNIIQFQNLQNNSESFQNEESEDRIQNQDEYPGEGEEEDAYHGHNSESPDQYQREMIQNEGEGKYSESPNQSQIRQSEVEDSESPNQRQMGLSEGEDRESPNQRQMGQSEGEDRESPNQRQMGQSEGEDRESPNQRRIRQSEGEDQDEGEDEDEDEIIDEIINNFINLILRIIIPFVRNITDQLKYYYNLTNTIYNKSFRSICINAIKIITIILPDINNDHITDDLQDELKQYKVKLGKNNVKLDRRIYSDKNIHKLKETLNNSIEDMIYEINNYIKENWEGSYNGHIFDLFKQNYGILMNVPNIRDLYLCTHNIVEIISNSPTLFSNAQMPNIQQSKRNNKIFSKLFSNRLPHFITTQKVYPPQYGGGSRITNPFGQGEKYNNGQHWIFFNSIYNFFSYINNDQDIPYLKIGTDQSEVLNIIHTYSRGNNYRDNFDDFAREVIKAHIMSIQNIKGEELIMHDHRWDEATAYTYYISFNHIFEIDDITIEANQSKDGYHIHEYNYNLLLNEGEKLYKQKRFSINLTKYHIINELEEEAKKLLGKEDTFFDDDFNYVIENDFYRNENNELCMEKNGKEVNYSFVSNIDKMLASKCNLSAIDNVNCQQIFNECIFNKDNSSIEQCKKLMGKPEYWIYAEHSLSEALPEVLMKILNKLNFKTITDNDLKYYELPNSWLKRIKKDFKLDDNEYNNIINNRNLIEYLTMIVNRINHNPIILNENYIPSNSNIKYFPMYSEYPGIKTYTFPKYITTGNNVLAHSILNSIISYSKKRPHVKYRLGDYLNNTLDSIYNDDDQTGGGYNNIINIKEYEQLLKPNNHKFKLLFNSLLEQHKMHNKTLDPKTFATIQNQLTLYENTEKKLIAAYAYTKRYYELLDLYSEYDNERILTMGHLKQFVDKSEKYYDKRNKSELELIKTFSNKLLSNEYNLINKKTDL